MPRVCQCGARLRVDGSCPTVVCVAFRPSQRGTNLVSKVTFRLRGKRAVASVRRRPGKHHNCPAEPGGAAQQTAIVQWPARRNWVAGACALVQPNMVSFLTFAVSHVIACCLRKALVLPPTHTHLRPKRLTLEQRDATCVLKLDTLPCANTCAGNSPLTARSRLRRP